MDFYLTTSPSPFPRFQITWYTGVGRSNTLTPQYLLSLAPSSLRFSCLMFLSLYLSSYRPSPLHWMSPCYFHWILSFLLMTWPDQRNLASLTFSVITATPASALASSFRRLSVKDIPIVHLFSVFPYI